MSWKLCDLASCVTVLESGSRPKGGASTESGEIPSLGGENILRCGGITLSKVKRVPKQFYDKMKKGHVLNADVLINKDGAQTGKVGLYAQQNSTPACINEHLFLIRGNAQKITQDYLYYTLLSHPIQQQIDAQVSGSAQPGLKSDFLRGLFAKIPDTLSEQTKITRILTTVDQNIDQTEVLIAKLHRIKAGLMEDLLTYGIDKDGNLRSEDTHEFKDSPLGRIPVEWESKPLNDMLIKKQYGISTSLTEEPIGKPVLRMNNLVESELSYSNLKYSTNPIASKMILNDGDVLFNRTNSIDYVGRTAIYRHKNVPYSFASYLVRLVPRSKELLPEYLNLWLNCPTNQIRVKQLATIGVQQANVNPTNLGYLEAAVPSSLDEQHLIVDVILTSAKEISSIQSNLTKLYHYKTALIQDLLSGSVSVTPFLPEVEMSI